MLCDTLLYDTECQLSIQRMKKPRKDLLSHLTLHSIAHPVEAPDFLRLKMFPRLRTTRTSDSICISQETRPFVKVLLLFPGLVCAALVLYSARDLTRSGWSYHRLLSDILWPLFMIASIFSFATVRSSLEVTTTEVKINGSQGAKTIKLTDIVSVTAMRDAVFERDASPGVCIRRADGEDVVFRYIVGYAGRCRVANAIKCALDGDFRTQKERDDLDDRNAQRDPRARLQQ